MTFKIRNGRTGKQSKMKSEVAVRPCVIQIELAPGVSSQAVASAIRGIAFGLRPLLAADAVIEEAAGFGARRSPRAVVAVVSFAVGVSQGVAGNAVWQLLQSVVPNERSASTVNGTVVDPNSPDETLKRIERILAEGKCVRATAE